MHRQGSNEEDDFRVPVFPGGQHDAQGARSERMVVANPRPVWDEKQRSAVSDVSAIHPIPLPFAYAAHQDYKVMLCANCGTMGHVQRSCKEPVTSYGVICYRWTRDPQTNLSFPQFIMVRRKDSLCFVEFVRGKYDPGNETYIMRLLERMTSEERGRLLTHTFPELWYSFWQGDSGNGRNHAREFESARAKFAQLKRGYAVKRGGGGEQFVDIQHFLSVTACEEETEWGFPKGRRNINESDIRCALREFREETGMDSRIIDIHTEAPRLQEVFSGCNKVRYKHVYFLARLRDGADADVRPVNTEMTDVVLRGDRGQLREVSRVSWFSAREVEARIRPYNPERKTVFRDAYALVLQGAVIGGGIEPFSDKM